MMTKIIIFTTIAALQTRCRPLYFGGRRYRLRPAIVSWVIREKNGGGGPLDGSCKHVIRTASVSAGAS